MENLNAYFTLVAPLVFVLLAYQAIKCLKANARLCSGRKSLQQRCAKISKLRLAIKTVLQYRMSQLVQVSNKEPALASVILPVVARLSQFDFNKPNAFDAYFYDIQVLEEEAVKIRNGMKSPKNNSQFSTEQTFERNKYLIFLIFELIHATNSLNSEVGEFTKICKCKKTKALLLSSIVHYSTANTSKFRVYMGKKVEIVQPRLELA